MNAGSPCFQKRILSRGISKGHFNILRRLREPFSIRMIPFSAGSWRQAESTALLNVRFERSRAQDQGYADLRE
jgi:hypothetical protein